MAENLRARSSVEVIRGSPPPGQVPGRGPWPSTSSGRGADPQEGDEVAGLAACRTKVEDDLAVTAHMPLTANDGKGSLRLEAHHGEDLAGVGERILTLAAQPLVIAGLVATLTKVEPLLQAEAGRPIVCSADQGHQHRTSAGKQGMSVAARVDGDHFELPADAAERYVRYVPPTSSGSSRRSPRLQPKPGYEAMIKRMQRRERWPACGAWRAVSPSRLGRCAGGSSRPRSSAKKSSASPTPSE
jgi:hypothetical protein